MFEKIRDIICEKLSCEKEEISMETSFMDDLGVDSIELFDIIVTIEESYGIEIPSDELDKLLTVHDVVDYLGVAVM